MPWAIINYLINTTLDGVYPFKMTPELKFIIPIVQKLDRE